MTQIWVVVPAAGKGTRFGAATPKQYYRVQGQFLLTYTLQALLSHPRVAGAMVVLAEHDACWPHWTHLLNKPIRTCTGGASRAESVLAGLQELQNIQAVHAKDFVMVHDAARPNIHYADVERLFSCALSHAVGGLLATPVRDTLKLANCDATVERTVSRQAIWCALTPQLFQSQALIQALQMALHQFPAEKITDEAMAMECAGFSPLLVAGAESNFKITTVADVQRFEFELSRRSSPPDLSRMPSLLASAQDGQLDSSTGAIGCVNAPFSPPSTCQKSLSSPLMRIGYGFDVHAFMQGDHVMLGGLRIAHTAGLRAHSDGDVVLHALCDALLGALALGDIGQHFPPSDPRWANAESSYFLSDCADKIRHRGWFIANVDITIICEEPKISPHTQAMCAQIARVLQMPMTAISIKATTSERLGFTGRKEGIAAQAVALVVKDTESV